MSPTPVLLASVATPQSPIEVARVSDRSGFDWRDAGIGATGVLVLLAAGGGVVVTVRRGSHRRGLAAS